MFTTDTEIPIKATAISPQKIEKKLTRKISPIDSSSYDVIAFKNLFDPSRSIKKKLPEVSIPVSENALPQLFGTIIMNEKKLAILEDQSSNKSNLYKVNDSVSGFIVSQILENKVILQKGGESIEIGLRKDKKFKKPMRSQTRKKIISKSPTRRRRPPARGSRGS